MNAYITTVHRRTFGLPREIHVVGCLKCGWRQETRATAHAAALAYSHKCEEGQ